LPCLLLRGLAIGLLLLTLPSLLLLLLCGSGGLLLGPMLSCL